MNRSIRLPSVRPRTPARARGRRWWAAGAAVCLAALVIAVSAVPVVLQRAAAADLSEAEAQVSEERTVEAVTRLVLALEAERGKGSLLLLEPTGSDVHAAALDSAQALTDDAVEAWRAAAGQADGPSVTALTDLLAQLPDQRADTADRSIDLQTRFDWYGALTGRLVESLTKEQALRGVEVSVALLRLAEETSSEGSRIAVRIGAGTAVTDAAVHEVVAARAVRDSTIATVTALAPAGQGERVRAAMDSPAAARVEAIEQQILDGDQDAVTDLAADTWFSTATALVEKVAGLAEHVNATRRERLEAARDAARSAQRWFTVLMVVVPPFALGAGIVAWSVGSRALRSRPAEVGQDNRIRDHERAMMLAAVLDNSEMGIYVKDLHGRYLEANHYLLETLGRSREELLGLDDWSIDPDLAPIWRTNDVRAQRETIRQEEVMDLPEGRRIYRSIKFPLRDDAGEVYATGGISLDVTEQREDMLDLEQALREARVAEAAKSAFLATMSHEIRTPLNAVIGMSDLLATTALTPLQEEYVQTVCASGTLLLTAINDILDYSRFESGDVDLVDQPTRLEDVVHDALGVVAPRAGELDLLAEISPLVPPVVEVDTGRLRQVLVHLLGNAVKFTERGEILVRVDPADPADPVVPPESDGLDEIGTGLSWVVFSVLDTGIGIAPEQIDRLFEPFSQADGSATRRFEGSGLGLAICQAVVRALGGGRIEVTSTPGLGSTFRFALALAPSSRTPAVRGSFDGEEVDLRGRRVLVVDDNRTNLRILQAQLGAWGVETTTVADPLQALTDLSGGGLGDLDAVILDHHMPVLTGVDLARRIRSLPGYASTPLMLLTSVTGRPVGFEGLFDAFHTKPIRSSTLRSMIVEMVCGAVNLDDRSGTGALPDAALPELPALRILLAEDNLANQAVAVGMLEVWGHQVSVVGDGRAAVEAAMTGTYDIILMDIHMPVLDGITAARAIRSGLDVGPCPQIVAMTAGAGAEQAAAAAAGMDGFLLKPVRIAQLQAVLAAVPRICGPTASAADLDLGDDVTVGADILPPEREHPLPPVPRGASDAAPAGDRVDPQVADLPVFDREVLAGFLEQIGQNDDAGRALVTDAFFEQGDGWMEDLTSAAETTDHVVIREIVHTMASSSQLLGARRFHHRLTELGALARAQAPAPVLSRATELVRGEYRDLAAAVAGSSVGTDRVGTDRVGTDRVGRTGGGAESFEIGVDA